jgi:integrase/recombinase XerD
MFEDVMDKFFENLATSKAESTITRYLCSMEQLKPYLAGRTLFDINRRLLGDLVEDRQKEVTNATIRRDLTALSKLMNYAVGRGWCGERPNPVPSVMRTIEEKRDPINLPHDDDLALVMARADGPFPYLMKAALLTGCRLNELVSAKLRDHDPAARTLTVLGKRNKKRVIDLNWRDGYKLFDSLPVFAGKPWLFWRHEDKRARGDSKRKPTFRGDKIDDPSQNFRRITDATEALCEEEGKQFVRFVFHDPRHRHCVDYLNSGGDIYDLNKRVGHSTLKQTEEYLEHVTSAQARIAKYGRVA